MKGVLKKVGIFVGVSVAVCVVGLCVLEKLGLIEENYYDDDYDAYDYDAYAYPKDDNANDGTELNEVGGIFHRYTKLN